MARSGFKMKYSPAKGLGDFFSSLGKELKSNKKDIGGDLKKKYSGKAQRANEVPRSGESEYQFKVRTRKAKSKKPKVGEFSTKQKLEGNLVPNQELMNKKVEKTKPKPKEVKKETIKKTIKKTKKNNKVKNNKVKNNPQGRRTSPPGTKPFVPSGDDTDPIVTNKNKTKKNLVYGYPFQPIIDPILKQSMKLSGFGINNLFKGEPGPEIRSGIRKKLTSKKRGSKMNRKK